jgi:hypothetical protein
MSDMTAAEIARAFVQNHREHDRFVTKELHEAIVEGIRDDITKLESAVNKLLWSVIAVAFGVIGQLIIAIANRIGAP